jgi:translation initiation factor IF-3
LIDETGEMVGVVETDDARRKAHELGLDLVEVAPDVRPPVCRIMDFGKYKYEQSKKDRANKTKPTELKEVRLGRSMKIDPHDIEIRMKQARRFLMEGHKVQIVQNFRGREMAHRERGSERMRDIFEQLEDIAKMELAPRMAGRRMTMVVCPDRQKVQKIENDLKREAARAAASEAPAEPVAEEAPVEAPSETTTETSPESTASE